MTTRLTADLLGITERELEALIWVRDAIDPDIDDKELPHWIRFDMNNWGGVVAGNRANRTACGTACCIGGSMQMHLAGLTGLRAGHIFTPEDEQAFEFVADLEPSNSKIFSRAFNDLFFEYPSNPMERDRAAATAAIDRFLAGYTGNPWISY